MKIKAALKYQIHGMIRPMVIFYIIIYALIIIMGLQQAGMVSRGMRVESSGLEMASGIFIFVIGLNSFKGTFHMFLANGVSRKTMFESFLGVITPMAAVMALIDNINYLVLSSIGNVDSMFHQVYHLRYGEVTTFAAKMNVFLDGFVWMMFLYIMAAMIGFFITTIYYRMGKPLKLIVSIGVPVFLFMVLPYIDNYWFDGAIFEAWDNLFRAAWGINGHNPYIAVLTCFITSAVFSGLSFLAIRNATVKQ